MFKDRCSKCEAIFDGDTPRTTPGCEICDTCEACGCLLEKGHPMGWVTEVLAQGQWCPNGIVWPDEASALMAGKDLLIRWTVPTDYRAVEVEKEPNRPTWDEHVAVKGLPPRSVQL